MRGQLSGGEEIPVGLVATGNSWGVTQAGSLAQGGVGAAYKVHMHDFNFTVFHSKASPKLMLACATGQHIASAVLVARKAGKEQQEYLKVTFADLLISSFQTGGSADNINVTDQISFNFSRIEHEIQAAASRRWPRRQHQNRF